MCLFACALPAPDQSVSSVSAVLCLPPYPLSLNTSGTRQMFSKYLLAGGLLKLCPAVNHVESSGLRLLTCEPIQSSQPEGAVLLGRVGCGVSVKGDVMKGPWENAGAHKRRKRGLPGRRAGRTWPWPTRATLMWCRNVNRFLLLISPPLGKDLYSGLCFVLGILRGETPSCPQGTSGLGQCCLTPTFTFLE